ncbi:MAG: response regulator transcription factor [Lachnospiraceae bacterium]|nr:response regulator transcription factor [Lachnospiraceae bacterium]
MAQNEYTILIVDDDEDLSLLICDMLSDNGYDYLTAGTLDEAYEILEKKRVHLILLDINLPDGTGFELCEELRKNSEVPVIFASARTSEDDKITGLDMGADDYIAKPYSIKELMSRIKSLIRRTYGFKEKAESYTLKAGKDNVICMDTSNRKVKRIHEGVESEISLSLKEYDLLKYMCEHKQQALSKESLVNEIWGAFNTVEPSTLTVHIRWLREKLENDPSKPAFIKTVWGVGYSLSENED